MTSQCQPRARHHGASQSMGAINSTQRPSTDQLCHAPSTVRGRQEGPIPRSLTRPLPAPHSLCLLLIMKLPLLVLEAVSALNASAGSSQPSAGPQPERFNSLFLMASKFSGISSQVMATRLSEVNVQPREAPGRPVLT